ncbi:MAG TPA: response regulator transcription factor [Actinomycetales bacterium]|nr:response regulator transcription factor [Actinomycetales bacterium]
MGSGDGRSALIDAARDAYDRRSWLRARELLQRADAAQPLTPADLEMLATASALAGFADVGIDLLAGAHQQYLAAEDYEAAARCAWWAGMNLNHRGENARGGAWLARAARIVEEHQLDCAQTGYLAIPAALGSLMAGDQAAAVAGFRRAAKYGERFGDRDLLMLGRMGEGQALVATGQQTAGLALLDEVMLAVLADEVSPVPAGIIYCAVIEACHEVYDLRRAEEWTTALGSWCDGQPELVPFTGQCQVHRAELARLHGKWDEALAAAKRAAERFTVERVPAVGTALYEQAEIHRLRGEVATADALYREANAHGHEPQPGLALLLLAQGRVATAAASIHAALTAAQGTPFRSRLLPAAVEILLASGDDATARALADELTVFAAAGPSPWVQAGAETAQGAVLLAENEPQRAAARLRTALSAWQRLDVPFEAARTRLLRADVCERLGDAEGSRMEREAAWRTLRSLGAVLPQSSVDLGTAGLGTVGIGTAGPGTMGIGTTDLGTADAATGHADGARAATDHEAAEPSPLTAREVEVIRLVATGLTNRAIAAELFLSEKTVARHLSNIFTKLGLTTRSAATAYAYEHRLVDVLLPYVTQPRGTSQPR